MEASLNLTMRKLNTKDNICIRLFKIYFKVLWNHISIIIETDCLFYHRFLSWSRLMRFQSVYDVLQVGSRLGMSHLLPAGGGGAVIFGGGGIFLVIYWGGGVEDKITYGQGVGSCISSGIGGGGGSDVFHWSFFSLKVIAYGGCNPQTRLYPSSIMWDFLNHWATLEIKYALFLLNNNLFLQMSPSSFSAFNNNHYHQC